MTTLYNDVTMDRGCSNAPPFSLTEASEAPPAIIGEYIPDATDDAIDIEEAIERLANLSSIQYDQVRKAEARRLGIQLATLDNCVRNAKKIINAECDAGGLPFTEIEPWHEAIDPGELLPEITDTIRRFIVCEPETALAATLWAAMTWFIDDIKVAPLALITAPEMRCGKTQLLSILGKISYRPLPTSNISPSALFRSIEKWQPTLLIDEADAFVRGNDDLRGIINAGHTRDSAYTVRCVGDNHEPTRFNLWGAKALAGIGKLAGTLMDRAIILELRRKLPGEKTEKLHHAPEGTFETLRKKLARFAEDYGTAVNAARPDIPETLHDRAQDNWEPLLAIADTAGSDYGRLARETAIKLSAGNDEVPSLGVELLTDIYEAFEAKQVDRIFSEDLVKALCADDEKRWATYNFRSPKWITPKQLGQLLSKYDIKSSDIRWSSSMKTLSGNPLGNKKGYRRSQFEDAFQRYVSFSSTPPETAATPATTPEIASKSNSGAAFDVADVNATQELVADVEHGVAGA